MISGYPPFYDDDAMILYSNILQCKLRFTDIFDENCKDLIKNLVIVDLSKRFGHLVGGVADIKNHAWFADFDWNKLMDGKIEAPYIPPIMGNADASNFDSYEENFKPYGYTSGRDDGYADKFKDF
jgi:protein kinase A